MEISREDVVFCLGEDAVERALLEQRLEACIHKWRSAAFATFPDNETASYFVPSQESQRVFDISWAEIDGQIIEMQVWLDAALAIYNAMRNFLPGAVRITPESSESGQEACWHDPTNWRMPARPEPVRPWYDTLPDDTACSLEEWNAKVDALLEDVAEFHRAIDAEDASE